MATSTNGMTDRAIAVRNLRNARARLARAERAAGTPVEWPGTRTAEWDRYIALENRAMEPRSIVDNLTYLLASTDGDDRISCRRVGFDSYTQSIIVDGDWVADLDCNGEDYCTKCAADMLVAGTFDPRSLHACYAYITDPDNAVRCLSCKTLIRVGAYMYAIVRIAESGDGAAALHDGSDPEAGIAFDPEADPRDWDTEADIPDGDEHSAIVRAAAYHAGTSARYQIRYVCYDDPYNNAVVWDSADPGAAAEAVASAEAVAAETARVAAWHDR